MAARGGMTGSRRVADARPDGYTFVLGTVGTHAQGQTLYKKPLYNSMTDFTPVALLAEVPIILTVRKDLPVKDFEEFVTYAQKNQKKMQFGSAGAGSATHLGCVLLNYMLKTDITHIPYKGTGPAMIDLAAGRIDFLCEIITTAKPHVDGGTVQGAGDLRQGAFARAARPADRARAGHQGSDRLYMERDLPAAENAGGHGRHAQRCRSRGDEVAERARQARGARRQDRDAGADDAEISRRSGKSEIEKWAVPIKASGVHRRVIAAAICKVHGRAKGRSRPSLTGYRPPAIFFLGEFNRLADLVAELQADPMVITACAESFSLPLSLPSATACRTAFSISRWPVTPRRAS